MAAKATKKAAPKAAAKQTPEKAASAESENKVDDDAKKANDAETGEPKKDPGADEMVTSPQQKPEPVVTNDSFVKIEKGNYVNMVTFYDEPSKTYGEFVLEDISGVIQKGTKMICIMKGSAFEIEFTVTPDEADNFYSKWRSLKAQRRNA